MMLRPQCCRHLLLVCVLAGRPCGDGRAAKACLAFWRACGRVTDDAPVRANRHRQMAERQKRQLDELELLTGGI